MSNRVLAVLSVVGIGLWAALGVLVGGLGLVAELRSRWDMAHPTLAPPAEHHLGLTVGVGMGVGIAVFAAWFLSLNLLVPAVVLGVIDIALVRKSWVRCAGFATVCVAGPAAALWVESAVGTRTLTGDDVATVGTDVGLMMIALTTFVVACLLLGARRQSDRRVAVPVPPPTAA